MFIFNSLALFFLVQAVVVVATVIVIQECMNPMIGCYCENEYGCECEDCFVYLARDTRLKDRKQSKKQQHQQMSRLMCAYGSAYVFEM